MTSHVDSNMVGKDGTETITNFATIGDTSAALVGATVTSSGAVSGTTITGSGAVQGTTMIATSAYIKVGNRYIIQGLAQSTSAAVIALATSLVSTPIGGSLVMNASAGAPGLWLIISDTAATRLQATA